MTDYPVCWIDTESDGVRPSRRTWEVAIIRQDSADSTPTEITLIISDAGVTGKEEPRALEVNHFETRFVRELQRGESRLPGQRAARIIHDLTKDAWFVAAQPPFDAHSLTTLLDFYGYVPEWKRRLRDIESLTEGHLGLFGIGGLATCATALGVEYDPSVLHTSMGDARLVRACWEKIFLRNRD